MTERLSSLLHEEAYDLPVPPAPGAAILARGRRLRVRRRVTAAAGVAAVASVVTGVAMLGLSGGSNGLEAATATTSTDWAVAQGSAIHLGSGATATVPGQVKSLYYTSAGTLVRVGATTTTDAPDSNYWLADDDGSVTDFNLPLGDRVPGTDPTLPYLAYATAGPDDTHWTVILRDVRTGEVATSIPIEGAFTWGGWVAPPVALDGDHVYVGLDDSMLDVDWRSGTATASNHLPNQAMPTVSGGHDVVGRYGDSTWSVLDAQTGATLLSVPVADDDHLLELSSDGRFALQRSYATCEDDAGPCMMDDPSSEIYDVATGAQLSTIDLATSDYGWTADGQLIRAEGGEVSICDPNTAACEPTSIGLGSGDIRVGGNSYES